MELYRTSSAGEVEAEWADWIPLVAFAIPAAVLVGATIARHALWPPRWPALFALIALVPFAVDALIGLGLFPARLRFPPLLFAAVVLGAMAPLTLVRPMNNDIAPFAIVMLVGEMASRLKKTQSLLIAAVPSIFVIRLVVEYHAPGFGIWVIAFAFAWMTGTWMQMQNVLTTRLREAQSGLAEKAAADERSRIAREVHDVIAHSMSVTMLHITAARMALEREQSSAALESLREAETQGRNSLNDIRRTVGLLGTGEDSDAPAEPMPSVTDLPKLVDDFRTAGLDVTLDMRGDIRGIAPAAGLNIYRIAQESLTNAAKYASDASARMTLNVTEEQITMSVRNVHGNGSRPRAGGNGLGIRGMSERASLLGGTLQTGSDGDDWMVFLTAPREAATA